MDDKALGSYSLFMAEALLTRIQALTAEVEGVRKAEDIECIHRMRVASRRLRSAFALFERHLPRKRAAGWGQEMRRITRALGAARDLDVQIEVLSGFLEKAAAPHRPGIERLLLRQRQRRDAQQAQVKAALDRLEGSRLAEEMGQYLREMLVRARLDDVAYSPELVVQEARVPIALRLEELLAYEPYIRHPECVEELHAMRIAAKRLRYTMEVFAPAFDGRLKEYVQVVRDAQEMLGDIHDADVWVDQLPRFLEEEEQRTLDYFGHARAMRRIAPGILRLQKERQEFRERRYKEFVAAWKQLREQEAWENLRRALRSGSEGP